MERLMIEDAIEHLDNILKDDEKWMNCQECKEEHKQLREWLEELRAYRNTGLTPQEIMDGKLLTPESYSNGVRLREE